MNSKKKFKNNSKLTSMNNRSNTVTIWRSTKVCWHKEGNLNTVELGIVEDYLYTYCMYICVCVYMHMRVCVYICVYTVCIKNTYIIHILCMCVYI